mgnify:FL=1
MGIMHLVYGYLSDNFGRKKIILLALIVYIFASLSIVLIDQSYLLLLFFRFLQSAGACVGIVLSIAIIKDITPEKETYRIIAFVISANMTIPIFSPIIGGILNENFDWKSIHIFLIFVSTPLLFYSWFKLDETNIHINQGQKKIQKKFYELLYKKNFYILLLFSLITIFTSFTFVAISPFLVITLKGYNSVDLGFMSFFVSLGFIVGSLFSGFFKFKAILMIKIGIIFCFFNYFFLFIYLFYINNFQILILYFFISLAALGKGLIVPSLSGLIVNFNKKISGTSLGFVSFIKLIFASLSILLIGRIIENYFLIIFFLYFVLYFFSLILIFFMDKDELAYTI